MLFLKVSEFNRVKVETRTEVRSKRTFFIPPHCVSFISGSYIDTWFSFLFFMSYTLKTRSFRGYMKIETERGAHFESIFNSWFEV